MRKIDIQQMPTDKAFSVTIEVNGRKHTATAYFCDNMTSEGTGSRTRDLSRQIVAVAANLADYVAEDSSTFSD